MIEQNTAGSDVVTLYWRPACGFCASLRRQLADSGLPIREINIWDDPAAAEVVQGFANGNETVPTVVVGKFGLVNPSAREVLGAVAEHAPHLLDTGQDC